MKMYDGYHIGNHDIYNPWSIINYAQRKVLEPYWVNTSANMMIRTAMEKSDLAFKKGYETLIQEGCLETQVLLETSFYEVASTETLWGLFMNAGYLTIDQKIGDERYRIKVPNQEVQKEFKKLTAH